MMKERILGVRFWLFPLGLALVAVASGGALMADEPDKQSGQQIKATNHFALPFRRSRSFTLPDNISIQVDQDGDPIPVGIDSVVPVEIGKPVSVDLAPTGDAWINAMPIPIRLSADSVDRLARPLRELSDALRVRNECVLSAERRAGCDSVRLMTEAIKAAIEEFGRLCERGCKPQLAAIQNDIASINERLSRVETIGSGAAPGETWISVDARSIGALGQSRAVSLGAIEDLLARLLELKDETGESSTRLVIAKDFDPKSMLEPNGSRLMVSMAVLPDPRVPRQKRAYDLGLQGISSGMRANGYELDTFDLPWKSGGADSSESGPHLEHVQSDPTFGVLLFRKDLWRHPDCTAVAASSNLRCGNEVWAVYVVPERASLGVLRESFNQAWKKVVSLDAGEKSPLEVNHPSCENSAKRRVLLWGPNFSGSLSSLRRHWLEQGGSHGVCAVSGATTVTSNRNASIQSLPSVDTGSGAQSIPQFNAYSLATNDNDKLKELAHFLEANSVPEKQVALLLEASAFGNSICAGVGKETIKASAFKDATAVARLCNSALRVPFRANVADIRYGRSLMQAERNKDPSQQRLQAPRLSQNLRIEEGAENGSEYPESSQSPLTRNGAELSIEMAIRSFKQRNIRAVVVAATEVRDRLFLLDRLRSEVPNALFVDLEADSLLAHPDVVHATRGTLVLASAPLLAWECMAGEECKEDHGAKTLVVNQTDRQALLREAVRCSGGDPSPKYAEHAPCGDEFFANLGVKLHVVTRAGLALVPTALDGGLPLPGGLALWIGLAIGLLILLAGLVHSSNRRFGRNRNLVVAGCGLIVSGLLLLTFRQQEFPQTSHVFGTIAFLLIVAWQYHLLCRASTRSLVSYDYGDADMAPLTTGWITSTLSALVLACGIVSCIAQALRQVKSNIVDVGRFATLEAFDLHSGQATFLAIAVGAVALTLVVGWYAVTERQRRADGQHLIATLDSEPATELRAAYAEHRAERDRFRPLLIPLGFLLLVFSTNAKPGLFGTGFSTLLLGVASLLLLVAALALLAAWREGHAVLTLARSIPNDAGPAKENVETTARAIGQTLTGVVSPATTPAFIRIDSLGEIADLAADPKEWSSRLHACLFVGDRSTNALCAMVLMLARPITRIRRLIWIAMGACFAVVVLAYLTTFSLQDPLVLVALVLLLATALVAGLTAHSLEHSMRVRQLLSQRNESPRWSGWIFGMVATPLTTLSIALVLLDNPGVLQGGDGIVQYLLSLLRSPAWH